MNTAYNYKNEKNTHNSYGANSKKGTFRVNSISVTVI